MSLGPERLARAGADGASLHDRVQAWLQEMADLAGPGGDTPRVPRLAPHAVPDQVVVLVREALGDPTAAPEVGRRLVELRRWL